MLQTTWEKDDDSYVPGLKRLAEVIHSEGTLAFLQINHAGRYAYLPQRLAPSPEGAEGLLKAGKADLIGLARVLFADPLWPKKAQGVANAPIIPCNPNCSLCMRRVLENRPAFCSQWGKEEQRAFLKMIGERSSEKR